MPRGFQKIHLSILAFLWQSSQLCAQSDWASEIRTWQAEMNASFADAETSPLTPKALKKFKTLPFFKADERFVVRATLVETPETVPFEMPTSTARKPVYRQWGLLEFSLEGRAFRVPVFVSIDLMNADGYGDYLFFPFTDRTSGGETYGGGRYLDLRLPASGTEITVDFNRAYNPYCAYSDRYSCPIVPADNFIDAEIRAGVMAPGEGNGKKH
ncbi:DUF1684 domain-containing protein [bacterium]|nr:DUF1684 domain-containing protein [bacterium]